MMLLKHMSERRLRTVEVLFEELAALLQMDGATLYKMKGWPEGAQIVAAEVDLARGAIILIVHHPDFRPITPGLLMLPPVRIDVMTQTIGWSDE